MSNCKQKLQLGLGFINIIFAHIYFKEVSICAVIYTVSIMFTPYRGVVSPSILRG